MDICLNCGHILENRTEEEKFCDQCGKRLAKGKKEDYTPEQLLRASQYFLEAGKGAIADHREYWQCLDQEASREQYEEELRLMDLLQKTLEDLEEELEAFEKSHSPANFVCLVASLNEASERSTECFARLQALHPYV